MTRILTAGAPDPPRAKPAFRADPVAAQVGTLFGILADLNLLGWQKRSLVDANDRLAPKLADPALMAHPKRAAYVALFDERDLRIRVLDRQAEPFLRELAQAWQRLPAERQAAFRAEPGWPAETGAVTLARAVFDWFSSGGYWLAGGIECGF